MVTIYSFRNPNWFTTFPISIDPWIYWGAGDNFRLSYLNGFENTYYLQRFILILPQVLAQNILGPYWSQLAVALFWLLTTIATIWFLTKEKFVFLGIVTILILDRTTMGAFGMSYSQAASIALMFASLVSMCLAVESFQGENKEKSNPRYLFALSGVFAGGLMNAYSPIAAIFIPCLVLCFLILAFNRIQLNKIISSIMYFTLGLGVLSLIIQGLYSARFNSQKIILLQQLSLGQNLVRNKNSWGGEAGLDGFYAKVTNLSIYHWWFGALIFFVAFLLTIRESKFRNLRLKTQFLILYSIISTGVFILSHFTYTFFARYSWTAVMMILPEIIGVYLLLTFYQNKLDSKQKSLAISTFSLIGFITINDSRVMSGKNLNQLIIFSLLVFFLLLVVLLRKTKEEKMFHLKLTSSVFLIMLSLISLRSSYLSHAGDLAGGGKDAKLIYYETSSQRSTLLQLAEVTNLKYRIWLTPENSTPLVSSMLYAYSLISTERGVAQCSQVEWAASTNSIVATFIATQNIEEIEKVYLAECGFKLKEIESEQHFENFVPIKSLKFGVLQRVA